MSNTADQPAFPIIELTSDCSVSPGLNKREYFAAKAMQGLLSDVEAQRWLQTDSRYNGKNFSQVVAINSIEFADALIEELDKPKAL